MFGCRSNLGFPDPVGGVFRFNSLGTGMGSYGHTGSFEFIDTLEDDCFAPTAVYGNIMYGLSSRYACRTQDTPAGIVYSYNVLAGPVACGNTDSANHSPASLYTNEAANDFTLSAHTRAIDFVPADQPHPRTDIGGVARPKDFAVDAGAEQWEPPTVVLGRSIGALKIGEPLEDVLAFYGSPRSLSKIVIGNERLRRVTFSSTEGHCGR